MPSCAAVGCRNRSSRGGKVHLKRFPSDPQRRALWASKVKRLGWYPTNNSYLCEVHFDRNQWERTREDGSRRLKWNAVPMLFSREQPDRKRKPIRNRNAAAEGANSKECAKMLDAREDEPSKSKAIEATKVVLPALWEQTTEEISPAAKKVTNEKEAEDTSPTLMLALVASSLPPVPHSKEQQETDRPNGSPTSSLRPPLSLVSKNDRFETDRVRIHRIKRILPRHRSSPSDSKEITDGTVQEPIRRNDANLSSDEKDEIISKLREELSKANKTLAAQHHQIWQLKRRNHVLEATVSRLKKKPKISPIFNEDQMYFLERGGGNCVRWCEDTIKTALGLEMMFGRSGYQQLLDLKLPFPSLRTLRRKRFDNTSKFQMHNYNLAPLTNGISTIDDESMDELSDQTPVDSDTTVALSTTNVVPEITATPTSTIACTINNTVSAINVPPTITFVTDTIATTMDYVPTINSADPISVEPIINVSSICDTLLQDVAC